MQSVPRQRMESVYILCVQTEVVWRYSKEQPSARAARAAFCSVALSVALIAHCTAKHSVSPSSTRHRQGVWGVSLLGLPVQDFACLLLFILPEFIGSFSLLADLCWFLFAAWFSGVCGSQFFVFAGNCRKSFPAPCATQRVLSITTLIFRGGICPNSQVLGPNSSEGAYHPHRHHYERKKIKIPGFGILCLLDYESEGDSKSLGFFIRKCGLLLWLTRAQHDDHESKCENNLWNAFNSPLRNQKRTINPQIFICNCFRADGDGTWCAKEISSPFAVFRCFSACC